MNIEKAIDAYIEKFGGFPAFCLMGMPDEEVAALITRALETGEELKFDFGTPGMPIVTDPASAAETADPADPADPPEDAEKPVFLY